MCCGSTAFKNVVLHVYMYLKLSTSHLAAFTHSLYLHQFCLRSAAIIIIIQVVLFYRLGRRLPRRTKYLSGRQPVLELYVASGELPLR